MGAFKLVYFDYMKQELYFLPMILSIVLPACHKNEAGPETFDHTSPQEADRMRSGAVVLKSAKKDFVYFSHSVFAGFPTDFWLYDSISSKWIPRADFPGKDRLLPITLFYNDQIFSGLSKAQPQPALNDWFSYDIQNDRWSAKANCPYAIPAAMTGIKSGSNIVIGCEYPLSDIPLCHFIYQVLGDSWKKSAPPCDSISRSCY